MELLKKAIYILDILYWVNRNFKATSGQQIPSKEFYNDAVNNNVELKPSMANWAKQTKIQVRNCQSITHGNLFNLCAYHWILNPHQKSVMLQKYNEIEWGNHRDALLLRAFWDPQMRRNRKSAEHYMMEVRRDHILDDSLEKIVNCKFIGDKDPLKLPMRVIFKNEPAIDEGGVTKEYLALLVKEVFNPNLGMFKYNEDNQLYWFNGATFEPNLNFELVGTLMGLAIYNNMFIDMPMVHACYKLLLDVEPSLEDYAQW